ncbi:hypothetical protein O6H91_05G024400 [Diphasiastrum complanatum]|uniref:Uncharacterized protein n=1 Tax=Diphasiastrum complanatum TaxID=34168 RepID=A0ACC2DLV7_DIPCM|nr:hypothetical protein O6H91_05G024400 [Diphasiastrum complanatum]
MADVPSCSSSKRGKAKAIRVSFEGNVGVGKSSLLHMLRSDPRLSSFTELLDEPVGGWQNVHGTGLNILQAFYENPHRYAYLFQSFVFITRFLQHNSASISSGASLLLAERCVLTDRYVFVETATEQGFFNNFEVAVYDSWYNAVVSALPNLIPDCFVYLRAQPEVCHDRLRKRARSEEIRVSIDYLKSLHEKHEKWFMKGEFDKEMGKPFDGAFKKGATYVGRLKISALNHIIQDRPVLVVDYDLNFGEGKPTFEQESMIEQIVTFLLGLLPPASERSTMDKCSEPL